MADSECNRSSWVPSEFQVQHTPCTPPLYERKIILTHYDVVVGHLRRMDVYRLAEAFRVDVEAHNLSKGQIKPSTIPSPPPFLTACALVDSGSGLQNMTSM